MTGVLYALLIGAVISDLMKHKIYNRWVLPGLAAGVTGAWVCGGGQGLLQALQSCLLAFGLLFPVYLAGGIGAGDVKLFTAAAAWLDAPEVVECMLCAFVIGGLISIVCVLVHRRMHGQIRFAVPVFMSIVFLFGGKI